MGLALALAAGLGLSGCFPSTEESVQQSSEAVGQAAKECNAAVGNAAKEEFGALGNEAETAATSA